MPETGPGFPGPEDDLDRRLRELTEGLVREAVIKEPSHAERSRRPGWRARRQATRQRSQQARSAARRQRGRTVTRWLAFLSAMAVLGALLVMLRHHPASGAGDRAAVTHGPVPSLTPSPTPSTLTAADPFAGSPAETYAAGAAGILIPPAHPLPGYPAAQVARAYRITRQLLVAANLDATTLRGGSPDAFARLLVPRQQAFFVKQLDHMGLDRHGYARSTREWVASFAPGSTQFPGNVIKVNGMMSARVAQVQGSPVLRVHADYLFVYPVERPAQPSTLMRVVLQDQVNVDFANWANPRGGPLEAWWNLDGGGASGARCDVSDGFIHPAFPNGTPEKVQPSGRPIDPYRLSAPARVPGCQATTGT